MAADVNVSTIRRIVSRRCIGILRGIWGEEILYCIGELVLPLRCMHAEFLAKMEFRLRADVFKNRRNDSTKWSGADRRWVLTYTSSLAAMGNRRPYPKAFAEILRPGAACWRLYSARSTMRITRRTTSISKLWSAA